MTKTYFKAKPPKASFITGRSETRCGRLVPDAQIVDHLTKVTCAHCFSTHTAHARRFMGRSGR